MDELLFDKILTNNEYTLLCSDFEELLKILKNFKGHEHVAFFYDTEKYRDKIFKSFFETAKNTNTPSLYYCKNNSSITADKILHYDDLLDNNHELDIQSVIREAIKIHEKNRSGFATRLGGEDSTWYIGNGFFEDHQKFEAVLGTSLNDDFSVICGYDIQNISNSQILSVIKYYGFIIFEKNNSLFVLTPLLSESDIENRNLKKIQDQTINDKKFSLIGKFASNMAHDMRNPLSVIQASMENVRLISKPNDETKLQMDRIDRAIQRMAHQVNGVLGFIESKPLSCKKIKFSKIIDECLGTINIPGNIQFISPKNNVDVYCDSEKFSMALYNLVLNGIQSITGSGTIEISIEEEDDKIVIQVKDSGKGIPKEQLNVIFDPLFTTKLSGTGLGLASVKSIIDSHKGTISVTSNPTTFTITLPKILEN